uniref:Uncharacterized protein n=1 Tax=Trichobilharzia regenti TaxID=157069 RepID=A0AA85JMZ8_TRIRE|nr:unnamed protein product [Trichobilharzia regenti]
MLSFIPLTIYILTYLNIAKGGHLSVSVNLQSCDYSVRTQADGTLCDQVERSFCLPVFKICLHTDNENVCSQPLPRNFELIKSNQGNSVIWKNASNIVNLSTVIDDRRSMDGATLDIKVFNKDDDEGNIVDRFAYYLTERLNSLRSGKLVTWTNTTQTSIRGSMHLQLSITAIYTPDNDDNYKEIMKQPPSTEIQLVGKESKDYPECTTSR